MTSGSLAPSGVRARRTRKTAAARMRGSIRRSCCGTHGANQGNNSDDEIVAIVRKETPFILQRSCRAVARREQLKREWKIMAHPRDARPRGRSFAGLTPEGSEKLAGGPRPPDADRKELQAPRRGARWSRGVLYDPSGVDLRARPHARWSALRLTTG